MVVWAIALAIVANVVDNYIAFSLGLIVGALGVMFVRWAFGPNWR